MKSNIIFLLIVVVVGVVGSLIIQLMFGMDEYDTSRINDLKATPLETSLNKEILLEVTDRAR